MGLIQRPAQNSDIISMCDTFFAAFAGDLVMAQCFPDLPTVREFWTESLQRDIQDLKCHVRCIVDTELPDSPVIAYAKWEACDEKTIQEGPLCPEGGNMALAKTFFPVLREKKGRIMEGRKYWYLACLCCRPSHQGRGAGRQLLEFCVNLVDIEGKEAYLEASPPGVPLYTKFGWKEVDRVVVLDGQFTEILMKRDIGKLSNNAPVDNI